TLENMDLLDSLFSSCQTAQEAISKFILILSGCETLEAARIQAEINTDLLYFFRALDKLQPF
ncbi:MAG TPA: hypothetical protein VFD03_01425, partial [Clostridia bacterium]|nr:hypothetical protein [Clostridia bacterium]